MNEITELDDKYLVLKIDDISERLTEYGQRQLNQLVDDINSDRKQDGKNIQKYVVLNLVDKIDTVYLTKQLEDWIQPRMLKVEDIATDLVNAVLKAEE